MPKARHTLTRRSLLELAAATGALGFLSHAAIAAEPTPPPCDGLEDADLVGVLLWAAFKAGCADNHHPG